MLVDNNPGVLSRISGLFSRRGYSIDSITAGMTADPRFTRITVVSSGDELILSQIEKQVRKLEAAPMPRREVRSSPWRTSSARRSWMWRKIP